MNLKLSGPSWVIQLKTKDYFVHCEFSVEEYIASIIQLSWKN